MNDKQHADEEIPNINEVTTTVVQETTIQDPPLQTIKDMAKDLIDKIIIQHIWDIQDVQTINVKDV